MLKPTTLPIIDIAKKKRLRYIKKRYEDKDIKDAFLVVAATNNRDANKAVFAAAKKYKCLLNIVDKPDDSNFIVPSLISRGDLTIAVSTGGKSPALAKQIRKELQEIYGKEYQIFIKAMGRVREKVLKSMPSEKARKQIFTKLAKSNIINLLKKGNRK